jgi:hypothetical protein
VSPPLTDPAYPRSVPSECGPRSTRSVLSAAKVQPSRYRSGAARAATESPTRDAATVGVSPRAVRSRSPSRQDRAPRSGLRRGVRVRDGPVSGASPFWARSATSRRRNVAPGRPRWSNRSSDSSPARCARARPRPSARRNACRRGRELPHTRKEQAPFVQVTTRSAAKLRPQRRGRMRAEGSARVLNWGWIRPYHGRCPRSGLSVG